MDFVPASLLGSKTVKKRAPVKKQASICLPSDPELKKELSEVLENLQQQNKQLIERVQSLERTTTYSGGYGPPATRGFYGAYTLRGRGELKVKDMTATNNQITNTGTIYFLNGIATGTTITTRIGRKATMKSILMNINVFPLVAGSVSNPHGVFSRFMIVYDSQPNSPASVPAVTDILQTTDPNSPLNLNNRDRFWVIAEMKAQIGSFLLSAVPALTAGSPVNKNFSKYRKLNKEIIFSGDGATIGDISTGALYLLVIADVTTTVAFDYYSRVRYTDL
ncbi:capsid protein [Blackfly DNA Virus 11]|nr:capsid protein [Blackfly DNA Virus 11]